LVAEIFIQGKKIADFTGGDLKIPAAQLKMGKPDIKANGTGICFISGKKKAFLRGFIKESDNYLKVRRHFFNRFGNAINGNTFKQNELVIVQISLDKSYSNDIHNIVITDMIPAGFEIENPRTKEIPGMDLIKDNYSPVSLDVRDDRINFFVNAENLRQNYYYAVRAVSTGVFKMGPVSADAMYNGEYHSYNGGGTIKVVE
jgi:hypothetical protein